MTEAAQIGLVGLGVMGRSLAFNLVEKGVEVAAFEPLAQADEARATALDGQFEVYPTLSEMVNSLAAPRSVLLMITAGEAVDELLAALVALLSPGDLVIDGGNSYFADTQRRHAQLADQRIDYLGLGVSGGEYGARHGPSLMAGGSSEGFQRISPILNVIAAQVDGEPCCAYLGADGAGHFVKMVHNGIEYADLQLIAEVYDLLQSLGCDAARMQTLFQTWNEGELNAYLIEITAEILGVLDPETGRPLVDMIEDKAGQKGTGRWTAMVALELGVPVPTIQEAVSARALSALKEQRVVAERLIEPSTVGRADGKLIDVIPDALLFAKIVVYAQGFALLRAASEHYNWEIPFVDVCRIWRGGCILRAGLISQLGEAFERNPDAYNLFFDPYIQLVAKRNQLALRRVVATATALGVPIPALSSALAYFDSFRRSRSPANLIQAQRDYFGAHGFNRIDQPGTFHHRWPGASGD